MARRAGILHGALGTQYIWKGMRVPKPNPFIKRCSSSELMGCNSRILLEQSLIFRSYQALEWSVVWMQIWRLSNYYAVSH